MTKKHFIALANMMRDIQPAQDKPQGESVTQDVACGQWSAYVLALADFCADQNPRFNRGRWLNYIAGKCGPNGGVIRTPKTEPISSSR